MLKNRLIGLIDVTNFDNHFASTMLLANIIEKQYDNLVILDLNDLGDNKLISSDQKVKKEADLSTFKILDRSLYQTCSNSSKKALKMLEIANAIVNKNSNLLISFSLKENEINKQFTPVVKELVMLGDIKTNLVDRLLKFFVNNDIKDKQIKVIIYNYEPSINNEKELLNIRKMLTNFKNVEIITLNKFGEFKSLKDITNIDPWDELYKTIKKII